MQLVIRQPNIVNKCHLSAFLQKLRFGTNPKRGEEEMSLQVELLEQSFEDIKPNADEFVNSFYNNLFTANPEAKPLFETTNMAEQKKKLLNLESTGES